MLCFLSFTLPSFGAWRICPMGDSITSGYTDPGTWIVPFNAGYRSGLYKRLTNNMSFEFVGTSGEPWNGQDGPVANNPSIDLRSIGYDQHEGHSGQNTRFVLSNISHWLTVDRPNVILLMIGINDLGGHLGATNEPFGSEINLSNIVAMVVKESPQTHVIVAQITPYAIYTPAIIYYNDFIANVLVPHFASQGAWVTCVNQYTSLCFPNTTNIDPSLFSWGGTHPGAVGYDRMAQTWYEGILALHLPPSPPSPIQDVQPVTASAFVRDQITFSAVMGSDHPVTYQWLRVSDGVTNNISGATNTTLTLSNLQLTDTTSYCLRASNTLGVGVSSPGSLTISSLPAPMNNLVIATAAETGLASGVLFNPGWAASTNNSLIAGQSPSTALGDFSKEVTGRSVDWLTAGGSLGIAMTAGKYGPTCSTNYVTCGNGTGPDGSRAGSTIIYALSGSSNGYNLKNITVYGGWANNRRDQQAYSIYYSTATAPSNYIYLATVDYDPKIADNVPSATRVTLTSATRWLAANVAAVKFDFTNPGAENGYCGYARINIFGVPSSTGNSNSTFDPSMNGSD